MRWKTSRRGPSLSVGFAMLAALIAAATMYMLDPEAGRGRRSRFRQSLQGQRRRSLQGARHRARDLMLRSKGYVHEAVSSLNGAASDADQLERRVRSKVGHVVTSMHDVHVTAKEGTVTLSGPLPEVELARAMRVAKEVPGVQAVRHTLNGTH